jgi:uncharacterized protein (TIGR00251 family)
VTPLEAIRGVINGVRIEIRVTPRASRTSVEGIRGGRVLVRVTAPPVDSAANEAVVALMAGVFDVSKRAVRVIAGGTARNKVIEVDGVTVRDATARLIEI